MLKKSVTQNFEQKLAKNVKNDNKSFFSQVRSKQRTVEKVGPMKDSLGSGSLITKDKDVSCLLNNYFSSVFTLEDIQNILEPMRIFKGDIDTERLLISLITPELVEKKLEKLNVNKCPGLDGIHPRVLFEIKNIQQDSFFSVFLEFGVVPADWKDASITPLFKKGKI